ncbi:5-oxoprolinase [Fulvivirga sp. M361]|uniref:hydantoinase B/oxoprolinase family protein n=1 Tax=Fulvivirga sp. M361 TaxID=2594266 RepID=UPI00117B0BF1|nr:hydantoinase B/oxoprolinase family protein [Fulvivirga sp. M361]TRX50430.1 5-oxoprolinase [Fulvivirga sp. M361]
MWQLWIDTGGTFTDCIAVSEQKIKRLKVLSNSSLRGKIIRVNGNKVMADFSWSASHDIFHNYTFQLLKTNFSSAIENVNLESKTIVLRDAPKTSLPEGTDFQLISPEEVPIFAARLITGTPLNEPLPLLEMRLGSTKGTNALLERKGQKVAFLVTEGFKDLLVIRDQQRPDLFTTNIKTPPPVYEKVIEISERLSSDGQVIKALNTNKLLSQLKKLPKDTAMAIALVNSYKNDIHEQELKKQLVTLGFKYVSCSAALSKAIKILPRAETAVVNAYLQPIISSYINGIETKLDKGNLRVMASSGSIVSSGQYQPKDSLLSGPAGGIVGAVKTAELAGENKIITFDMGGTSTDVAIYNNQYDYSFETKVGNAQIVSPSLHIETIAAGGGSICAFRNGLFTVGPESAGAYPGPACYGAGGPLTITDVNLLSGKIAPQGFSIPLSKSHAREAAHHIIDEVYHKTSKKYSLEELLTAFTTIANEKMAEAIRKVSLKKGYDPKDYTLVTFGGAGGQHACQIAQLLGVKKIIIPYDAGLLSAYGIGHADIEVFKEKVILETFASLSNVDDYWNELKREAFDHFTKDHHPEGRMRVKRRLYYLRFKGQENTLEIEEKGNVLKAFEEAYKKRYGHWLEGHDVEVESLRLIAVVRGGQVTQQVSSTSTHTPLSLTSQLSYTGEKWEDTTVYSWENISTGATIAAPSILSSNNTTVHLGKGWNLVLNEYNAAILHFQTDVSHQTIKSKEANIELYKNRFMSVVEDMGAILRRTSFSVNVKERQDFSCALMDAQGYLIVNAPHIPVHLGSMGVCVRRVMDVLDMQDGDVVITNHPGYGGSHLPDITLISPVYIGKELLGFVANRAHHSEIGGKTPGSMPTDATSLEEEGVIITPQYLIKQGQEKWSEIKELFTQAVYPSRAIEENLADLRGGIAALKTGIEGIKGLCDKFGMNNIQYYMKGLKSYVANAIADSIKPWKGEYQARERLDDGTKLQVTISIDKRITFDFKGTGSEHRNNLNATPAIVNSVILYVLRLMLDKDLPLNEGLLDKVDIHLPQSLLNPDFSHSNLPAVVGGNTEVSQRLTDTLLKALRMAACSQGTMNNLLFGNSKFGYYETICGGTGAGKGFHGHDAIHQHMTNTKITDPEIIEHRYPVRLEEFTIRNGSGGTGIWNGGNGIVRTFTFLEALSVTFLTQHRLEQPYGLHGGEPGQAGEQFLIRRSGVQQMLPGIDNLLVENGDQLTIKTPGGGGWGDKANAKSKT